MKVEYHPAVEQDVAEALDYYDGVSPILGDEFKKELRHFINLAVANPGRFHPISSKFRRANLKRFPYHFLYREIPDGIRITLVRHHKRNPDYGAERE
ncbi:MAG TPA: type II toxin-antitoxin system RelE/ParE family toxin [Verrucomicrobiae bacterium]|nr:type II toxin-antitoxin system RelE/ParE family toxin [Verrucomicrobiae bacterium]